MPCGFDNPDEIWLLTYWTEEAQYTTCTAATSTIESYKNILQGPEARAKERTDSVFRARCLVEWN
jgi:hypothetical protein